jgi:hypothetical protein
MSDNRDKSLHGRKGQEQLYELLNNYLEKGYINEYKTHYNTGYKGKKTDQFYFQTLVNINDEEKWLIQSTTSLRTDRINIQQWNAYHIKEIDKDITKAIIVYPDSISEKEKEQFKRYNDQISEGKIFSSIDNVISLSELDLYIENRALSNNSLGSKKAILGINLEEKITKILNSEKNKNKWNNEDSLEVGYQYPYFEKLMLLFGFKKGDKIQFIEANNNIPPLPSGGKPKTDVIVKIKLLNQEPTNYTISIKRTNSNWVSVHEYTAEQFIDVLKITDSSLKVALLTFQKIGNVRDLPVEAKNILEDKMQNYNEALVKWAYAGIGGGGNPNIHEAKYFVVFKENSFEMETWRLNEYINRIMKVKGQFGTPFRWTYPSKKRGKSIQLKGKIL